MRQFQRGTLQSARDRHNEDSGYKTKILYNEGYGNGKYEYAPGPAEEKQIASESVMHGGVGLVEPERRPGFEREFMSKQSIMPSGPTVLTSEYNKEDRSAIPFAFDGFPTLPEYNGIQSLGGFGGSEEGAISKLFGDFTDA